MLFVRPLIWDKSLGVARVITAPFVWQFTEAERHVHQKHFCGGLHTCVTNAQTEPQTKVWGVALTGHSPVCMSFYGEWKKNSPAFAHMHMTRLQCQKEMVMHRDTTEEPEVLGMWLMSYGWAPDTLISCPSLEWSNHALFREQSVGGLSPT